MKAERDLDANKLSLSFRDFSQLFIEMKKYPTSGQPTWGDTLQTFWKRVCDNTGSWDISEGKIVSSVEALRDKLVFDDPALAKLTLGEMTVERLHKMSKPAIPNGANAWAMWQHYVQGLGLVSYIDRDRCVVARVSDHFGEEKAPRMLWGTNVTSMSEEIDTSVGSKGVILRSQDPITGRTLEAHFPPSGDPRVKHPKMPRATKATSKKPPPDLLEDYEVYTYPAIVDQTTLDGRAEAAWNERRLQELQGKLTTSEWSTVAWGAGRAELVDMMPGDSISVEIESDVRESLMSLGSDAERVRCLVDTYGYAEDVAQLVAVNTAVIEGKLGSTYHVKSVQTKIGPDEFAIKLGYHNQIQL